MSLRVRKTIQDILSSGHDQSRISGTISEVLARNVVRVITSAGVIDAVNTRLPARVGLPVVIEHRDGAWQVVGIDHLAMPDPGNYHYVPHHAESHIFNFPGGGDDVVWVDKVQYTPGLVAPTVPPSLSVRVFPYSVFTGNGELVIRTSVQLISLESYFGDSTKHVLLTLSTDDGQVIISESATGEMPAVSPGLVPLAIIRLRPGATKITWNDIYDARDFPPSLPAIALSWVDNLSRIVRWTSDGNAVRYDATADGLGLALAESVAGDKIIVPIPLRLETVTVPAGVFVDLGFGTVGSVTLGEGAVAVNYMEE